ncbi:MAG: hypothetical protein DWQ07_19850 [Chloroflexi bacterium]|nr:MAG: hypothetical protein DWQ07_19850 [Chloroflexota bacterium]MBL1194338.1 hypothetical protein [Chloroflexota bacterium]NOH11628.1 hypothetical protein [Chloroflexota bacterium]
MSEMTDRVSNSLLAIDVGAVNTRAFLFDAVEGKYRFLASGAALSTATAPMHDTSEGVRYSMDELQRVTGRRLVGVDEQLIQPTTEEGFGVDVTASTFSGGPPLQVVTMGLLDHVSLRSANRLISSIYADISEKISIDDKRRAEGQIDAILRKRPDLVVIAGGTENGAGRSVLRLVNTLALALKLLPEDARPEVLYVGNQRIVEQVTRTVDTLVASVHTAANIRPSLGVEQLGPAEAELYEVSRRIYERKVLGVDELNFWAGGRMLPTSVAFGRVIRFLSKAYGESKKGVLGVDLGASSTTVAAALDGELRLNAIPNLGVGAGLQGLLNHIRLEAITRWLPIEMADQYVLDYLYNKTIYPASLPATPEDLAIELAVAREALNYAIQQSGDSFSADMRRSKTAGALPWFYPILVSGSVIAKAPNLGQSLMAILDGLQPTGFTKIILDQNALTSPMGAAGEVNPLLAVQVLMSNSFPSLADVIAPVGTAKAGSPVVQVNITYDTGQSNKYEVKYGSVFRVPLPAGRRAQVRVVPFQNFDVGWGPGRSGSNNAVGGLFGLIIDARGRPLELPASPERRREAMRRWMSALGR